jgi:hypothetical protein
MISRNGRNQKGSVQREGGAGALNLGIRSELRATELGRAKRTWKRVDRQQGNAISVGQVVVEIVGKAVVGLGRERGRVEMSRVNISPQKATDLL